MTTHTTTLAIALLLSACTPSFGEIILEYETGAASAVGLAPSTEEGVVGDNFIAGIGLAANAGSNFNWRGWDSDNTDFDSAIADSDFWTWGFTVSPSVTNLTLTDFDISVDRSGSGPDDFEIRASVNSGTEVSLLTHSFNDSSSTETFQNISLGAIPSLAAGDQVVFRLGAFTEAGDPSNSALGTLSLPSLSGVEAIAFSAEGMIIAVPEPTTTSLLALALAGGVIVRRRKG